MEDKTGIKVFSFDIFDTTLTRSFARPKDVFLCLQRMLAVEGMSLPSRLIKNFYFYRIQAEVKTRSVAHFYKRNEIKIEDIYQSIGKDFQLNQEQIDRLIDLEIRIEYGCVYPIAWTLSEINSLRGQDKKIVFTSDMYLPISLIKNMLIKVGAYHESDRIYLSGDVGLRKFDGQLFSHILQKEGCEARELCHWGDDIHSDVWIPHKLGITIYKTPEDQVKRILSYYYFKRLGQYAERFL